MFHSSVQYIVHRYITSLLYIINCALFFIYYALCYVHYALGSLCYALCAIRYALCTRPCLKAPQNFYLLFSSSICPIDFKTKTNNLNNIFSPGNFHHLFGLNFYIFAHFLTHTFFLKFPLLLQFNVFLLSPPRRRPGPPP